MTPEQEALVGLAAEIFVGRNLNVQPAAPDRPTDRWVSDSWQELADAGPLGPAVPEPPGVTRPAVSDLCSLRRAPFRPSGS